MTLKFRSSFAGICQNKEKLRPFHFCGTTLSGRPSARVFPVFPTWPWRLIEGLQGGRSTGLNGIP